MAMHPASFPGKKTLEGLGCPFPRPSHHPSLALTIIGATAGSLSGRRHLGHSWQEKGAAWEEITKRKMSVEAGGLSLSLHHPCWTLPHSIHSAKPLRMRTG